MQYVMFWTMWFNHLNREDPTKSQWLILQIDLSIHSVIEILLCRYALCVIWSFCSHATKRKKRGNGYQFCREFLVHITLRNIYYSTSILGIYTEAKRQPCGRLLNHPEWHTPLVSQLIVTALRGAQRYHAGLSIREPWLFIDALVQRRHISTALTVGHELSSIKFAKAAIMKRFIHTMW